MKKVKFTSTFLYKIFDKEEPSNEIRSTKQKKESVTFNDGTIIRILRKIRKSPALRKRKSPKKKSPKKKF